MRLHISPFTPALFTAAIPPSIQSHVTGCEYHSIATFPDSSYGYLDIPEQQATTLKARLNGSFIRGTKLKVEEARPDLKKQRSAEQVLAGMAKSNEKLKTRDGDKRKRKHGEVEGVELPTGRKVKRGWTEEKASSAKNKSSKSSGDPKTTGKVIFKTALPSRSPASSAEDRSGRKRKQAVEIQEFKNTSKHAHFLRQEPLKSGAKPAVEFVEGQGWVDEDGAVVEEVKTRTIQAQPQSAKATPLKSEIVEQAKADTSDASSESAESSEGSTDSSDDDDDDDDDAEDNTQQPPSPPSSIPPPHKGSSAPSPPRTSPDPRQTTETNVHPLEAIYKRTAPESTPQSKPSRSQSRPARIDTTFSFFGGGGGDDGDDDADTEANNADNGSTDARMLPPQTPFTKLDMDFRGIRSAAPTPDTAAIGRRFSFAWANAEKSDEEDEVDGRVDADGANARAGREDSVLAQKAAANADASTTLPTPATDGESEQNEFEKHFWANRGEYNRSWKNRKREARKEKRQAENKSSASRVQR